MLLTLLISFLPSLHSPARTLDEQVELKVRNVAIVVYSNVELLDFAGPGEVFSAVHFDGQRAFNVYTVSDRLKPIVSQRFVRVTPEYTYATCPKPDIVVVPGGGVPLSSPSLREFLQLCSRESELVMSVCNGAGALAVAGLLDGLEVTTHHGSLEALQLMAPSARVMQNRRFVDNGNILTSAGVSAGIDGALHVVSRMHGDDVAQATAKYMEYDWRPKELRELHAQPGEPVTESPALEFARIIREKSTAQALEAYQAAEAEVPEEAHLNRLGYMLQSASRPDDALRVFELVVAAFPESANASDSLAEAYEMLGRNELALKWSGRALELLESQDLTEERAIRVREASAGRVGRLRDGASKGAFACPPCGMPCDTLRSESAGHCTNEKCGMELVRVGPDANQ
jgi:transcriptional regulator GlxA family with amidase domain